MDLFKDFLKQSHSKNLYLSMLKVKVQDGEKIEQALKRMKRKFRNTKVLQKLRENQQFTKKSVKKRRQVQKAAYIQRLRDQENL